MVNGLVGGWVGALVGGFVGEWVGWWVVSFSITWLGWCVFRCVCNVDALVGKDGCLQIFFSLFFLFYAHIHAYVRALHTFVNLTNFSNTFGLFSLML